MNIIHPHLCTPDTQHKLEKMTIGKLLTTKTFSTDCKIFSNFTFAAHLQQTGLAEQHNVKDAALGALYQ